MAYMINPVPDMECQRYGPFGMVPDLTCGRYCLKSLLKYWHEKTFHVRINRLELPRPASTLSHWIGYDPWTDYQHGQALMFQANKPQNRQDWEALITRVAGPIILTGDGIGHAFRGLGPIPACGHVILLIGVDGASANQTFTYLDPLVGNAPQVESFAAMDPRIDQEVTYAKPWIRDLLSQPNHGYYTQAHFDMFPWRLW